MIKFTKSHSSTIEKIQNSYPNMISFISVLKKIFTVKWKPYHKFQGTVARNGISYLNSRFVIVYMWFYIAV